MAGSDEIMAVILTYINYSDYASVCLALFAFAVGLVIDLWRKTGTPSSRTPWQSYCRGCCAVGTCADLRSI